MRPVALSHKKVDVIVGNPPVADLRNTASTLRTELEQQSKDLYGIWVGGRYANHQDVCSLFYARSVDLYLKDGGVIGMVMPHSALQTGQYAKWRTGSWQAVQWHVVTLGFASCRLTLATRRRGTWKDWNPTPSSRPASVVFAQSTRARRQGGPAGWRGGTLAG